MVCCQFGEAAYCNIELALVVMYHSLVVLLAAICEFLFILRRLIYKHSVLVSFGNILVIFYTADESGRYFWSIAVCGASGMSKYIYIYLSAF